MSILLLLCYIAILLFVFAFPLFQKFCICIYRLISSALLIIKEAVAMFSHTRSSDKIITDSRICLTGTMHVLTLLNSSVSIANDILYALLHNITYMNFIIVSLHNSYTYTHRSYTYVVFKFLCVL